MNKYRCKNECNKYFKKKSHKKSNKNNNSQGKTDHCQPSPVDSNFFFGTNFSKVGKNNTIL